MEGKGRGAQFQKRPADGARTFGGAEFASLNAVLAVVYLRLELVGVPFELGRVHGPDSRRERGEESGRFGAHPVGYGRAPFREPRREEAYAVVAVFDVRMERVPVVSAALFDRLVACRFRVFEQNRLVLVLTVDDELDFNQIAGNDFVARVKRDT